MKFELFSESELIKVHELSLDILKKIGITTKSNKFREILLSNGCKEQNGRIVFTQDVIDKALKTVPSNWNIYGRDNKNVCEMGERKAYAQTCIGMPSIVDVETGEKRDVLLKDLEDFTRVFDAMEHLDIVAPIFPRDVNQSTIISTEVATMLRNTTKPIKPCLESAHEWKYVNELLVAISGSQEAAIEKPLGYYEISPISPLDFADDPAEALIAIVESGQPLGVIPAPILGATAPMSMVTGVAQHNAEILAGVIASQLIKAGSKVLMSSRLGTMDMRSGVALWAMPEMGLASAANMQLASYYNIPCGAGCFTGSSKVADAQSGYERMYNTLLPALGGLDVCGTAGAIDNALVASYEMMVIDNEIASAVKRTLKGVNVSEDEFAIDVLQEVIEGGSGTFLAHKHTRKQMRAGEMWNPTISQRQPWDAWAKDGLTTNDIANQKAKELIATHEVAPLSPEVEAEFDKILKCAAADLAK